MKNENGKSIEEQAAIILQGCCENGCLFAVNGECEVKLDPREVVLDLGLNGDGCFEFVQEGSNGKDRTSGVLRQGKVLLGAEV